VRCYVFAFLDDIEHTKQMLARYNSRIPASGDTWVQADVYEHVLVEVTNFISVKNPDVKVLA
jgi:hypothetical protein